MPRRMVRTGSRPRYVWVPFMQDFIALGGTGVAGTTDLLAAYVTDALRETGPGMVIERVIGSVTTASQVVGVGGQFTLGLGVAPEGGWSSAPRPQTEINDWLVWVSGDFSQNAIESAAGTFTPKTQTFHFDVRARRRLRAIGDEVLGIAQSESETLSIFSLQTRILMRVT